MDITIIHLCSVEDLDYVTGQQTHLAPWQSTYKLNTAPKTMRKRIMKML